MDNILLSVTRTQKNLNSVCDTTPKQPTPLRRQMTPAANYTRAIDTWFFACIMAVAMALFQYAIILQ